MSRAAGEDEAALCFPVRRNGGENRGAQSMRSTSCSCERKACVCVLESTEHMPGGAGRRWEEQLPLERAAGTFLVVGLFLLPSEYTTRSEKHHLLHRAFPDCQGGHGLPHGFHPCPGLLGSFHFVSPVTVCQLLIASGVSPAAPCGGHGALPPSPPPEVVCW